MNVSSSFIEFGYTVTEKEYFGDDFMPLRIMRQDSGGNFSHPVHKHEFTELVIITSGSAMHQIEGELVPLSGGDVFVVHEGHSHGYTNIKDMNLINILFKAKRLPLPLADFAGSDFASVLFNGDHPAHTLMHLSAAALKKITGYMDEIERENREKKSSYRFFSIAVLMMFLAELERSFPASRRNKSSSNPAISALEIMEKHYCKDINFEQIAKTLGLSRRSFFRNFQLLTNTSPHRYLIAIRLRHAMELLRNSSLSQGEIALRCGFNSGSVMNYNLRKFYGLGIRDILQGKTPENCRRAGSRMMPPTGSK